MSQMLLLHAKLLLEQGHPVYAEASPGMDYAVDSLKVSGIDEACITIAGVNGDKPLMHQLSMLQDVQQVRIEGFDFRLYSEEDPILTLLEGGLCEHELNRLTINQIKRHS